MEGITFADLLKHITQTVPNLPQDLYDYLIKFDSSVNKNRSKEEALNWSRDALTQLYNFYYTYGQEDVVISTHICLALARLSEIIMPYCKYETEVYSDFIKMYKQIRKIAEDRLSKVTEFNYLDGYNSKYKGLYYE